MEIGVLILDFYQATPHLVFYENAKNSGDFCDNEKI